MRDLWCKLGVPLPHINSFNENFVNWLRINSLSTARHNMHIPWCTVFLYAVWCLWKNRNNVVFENSVPNPKLHKFCIGQCTDFLTKRCCSMMENFVVFYFPPSTDLNVLID